MGRLTGGAIVLVAGVAWCAVLTGSAGAQSPQPGSAGREGSTLVIRNDGNDTQKTFYVANGAFYPAHLWMGNRRINFTQPDGSESYTYEPAYGPGCELEREGPVEFGGVRCPLAGVSEIVIDMGAGAPDRLQLMASGAAPPVHVRGGTLDALPVFGVAAQYASAPPALTTLSYQPIGTSGEAGAMFHPGQLQRFEVTGGAGKDIVRAVGAADVRVATGDGDDQVTVENALGSVEVSAGSGDDEVAVTTRTGATSSIDGGAGDDYLRSDDRVPTAITCGPGDDQLYAATADRPGAGCAHPVVGLEPFTGFASCLDVALRCDFDLGRRVARGTLNDAGTVVTLRGVGRLTRRSIVWGRVATEDRLYGSGALAAADATRRPAGPLELKLRLTKQGRRGGGLTRRKGLRLMLGTRTPSGDVSAVIADLDGIAFKAKR